MSSATAATPLGAPAGSSAFCPDGAEHVFGALRPFATPWSLLYVGMCRRCFLRLGGGILGNNWQGFPRAKTEAISAAANSFLALAGLPGYETEGTRGEDA